MVTRHPVLSSAGLVAGLGGGGGRGLGGVGVIEAVEALSLGAVKVEPPVAHKHLLVENGSVGTQHTGKQIFSFPSSIRRREKDKYKITICQPLELEGGRNSIWN